MKQDRTKKIKIKNNRWCTIWKGTQFFERVVSASNVKLHTLLEPTHVPLPRSLKAMVCATAMGFFTHDWPMASNQVGFCCGNTSQNVNKHLMIHIFIVFPAPILDFLTFNKLLQFCHTCHMSHLWSRAQVCPFQIPYFLLKKRQETIRNPVSWSWMASGSFLIKIGCKFQINSKDLPTGTLNLWHILPGFSPIKKNSRSL